MSSYERRYHGGQGGFSYLWVLLLVALLGVGMVLTAETYQTAVRRQQESELLFIGAQFREAIRRYQEAAPPGSPRVYPQSLEDLLQDNRSASARHHLRKIYRDPLTGKAEWGMLRVAGGIAGVHSLSEVKPLKQDGFDPAERAFKGAGSYTAWVFTYPEDLVVKNDGAESPDGAPAPK